MRFLSRKSVVTAVMLAGALALAGCGGGSDDPPAPPPTVEPTVFETAMTAIGAATTAADAQAAYDAVKGDVTAAEGEKLQAAVDERVAMLAKMARETAQKTTLMTAAGNVDTSDLNTAEAIGAATSAIAMLQEAYDAAVDVSAADKAMYKTQLDNAIAAVATAQDALDKRGRMTMQRTAISSAVTAARSAVNAVDDTSTDADVATADAAVAALKTAIEDAVDLPEGDAAVASAQGTLDTLDDTLAAAKTSRTTAIADKAAADKIAADKAAAADRKAKTALGKAMYAALSNGTTTTNALDNGTATLGTNGLAVDVADNAGTLNNDPDSVTLKAGASAGMGTNYSFSSGTGTSKVTYEALVYDNKDPDTRVTFAKAGYTVATSTSGDNITGYVFVVDGGTVQTGFDIADVMATAFTHSGTLTHSPDRAGDPLYLRGTYDGAPGEYRCTGTCTSTNDGSGAPSALAGDWHFKPDAGAMVSQPDPSYLYYGWWVHEDDKNMPQAASAFVGTVGTGDDAVTTGGDISALTGSATYAGDAIGQFAMNNPIDGSGDGGHFTADAALTATFSSANASEVGVTGTIDNFRLNDGSEDPGWKVSLNRGSLSNSGGVINAPALVEGANVGTVWSIDGNKANASGTWSGTMYDEAPSGASNDDGSNIPTTVTGRFYSEFSTNGRMVGAFGADKE